MPVPQSQRSSLRQIIYLDGDTFRSIGDEVDSADRSWLSLLHDACYNNNSTRLALFINHEITSSLASSTY